MGKGKQNDEEAQPSLMLTTPKSCQKNGRRKIDQDQKTYTIGKRKLVLWSNQRKSTKNHTSWLMTKEFMEQEQMKKKKTVEETCKPCAHNQCPIRKKTC